MTPRSPSAYFLSAFLHTAVAGTLVLLSFKGCQKPEEPPHIFELVAGEGDNYAATEAPALTAPVAPKVQLPTIKAPPTPKTPEPEPVIEPQPVIKPAPVPSPPKTETPKKETPKKQPEPPKKKEEPKQVMTKAEFDKLNKQKTASAKTAKTTTPLTTKKIDVDSITKGVAGGKSTTQKGAGGTALTAAEANQLDRYVALILQRIREALMNAGLSDQLEVRVEFRVSAGGAISSVRIVNGSGSREFDDAVANAFRNIRPIGPPPTNRAEAFSVVVRMRDG